jgi:hypothetical protein
MITGNPYLRNIPQGQLVNLDWGYGVGYINLLQQGHLDIRVSLGAKHVWHSS